MKVLFLEDTPTNAAGGQELSMFDVCVGLAARGHSVTLGYTHDGNLIEPLRKRGVNTLALSPYRLELGDRIRFGMRLLRGLGRALRHDHDVLVLNAYYSSLFGSIVSRLRRRPLVCHLRIFPPAHFCGQWAVGVRKVNRFIAVSEATKRAYVARGFDSTIIDVVHDGIDVQRFSPSADREAVRRELGIPPGARVLLSVGRIDHGKNIEGLLRIFAATRPDATDLRLLVVGQPVGHDSIAEGNAYLETLKEQARSLGIGSRVHWMGQRADLPALYSAADLSILTSRVPEALARVAYESMACGTPAITSNVGGMGEVLTGEFASCLFDPEAEEAAAALVVGSLDWRERDPGLAERMREHAVSHFSTEAMVRGIEASLRKAIRAGIRAPARVPRTRDLMRSGVQ